MIGGIDILGYFWGLLSNLLKPIVDFLIGFLPDGDPNVYAVIDGIGQVGSGEMTFNVFYFADWAAVLLCFGVLVSVALILAVLSLITTSIRLGSYAVEAVPVYE